MAKMVMLRLKIGSGSADACSALAQDHKPFKARGMISSELSPSSEQVR